MPTLTISSQNQTSLSDAERARLQALSGINKITATQTAPVATSPMAGTQAPATSSGFRIPASTAITSETLNPQVPTNFITPDPTLTYPTSALNSDIPELQATDQETKDSSLTQQLMDLNNSLTGEQAFRTEQETRQGLPDLFKTQTELASRVTALKNEALAIPLQLQQESIGRGITAGGLQPIQTAAIRNNAIQALSASSLLEASRGNITLANDLVDRLVEQKFGPDKEKQKALTANLELVRNDPQTSLQDKNRANKQIALIKKQDAEIARQEETAKTIFSLATEIAERGADPKTLAKVQNATSIEEALNLAAPFLGKMERQTADLTGTTKGVVPTNTMAGAGGGVGGDSGITEPEPLYTPAPGFEVSPKGQWTFDMKARKWNPASQPEASIYNSLGTATGKSLSANQVKLQNAGLTTSDGRIQEHYLSVEPSFREEWADLSLAGELPANLEFEQYQEIYNKWRATQDEDTIDWANVDFSKL